MTKVLLTFHVRSRMKQAQDTLNVYIHRKVVEAKTLPRSPQLSYKRHSGFGLLRVAIWCVASNHQMESDGHSGSSHGM